MCTLVNDKDDGTTLSLNNTTGQDNLQVANSVVINAAEVNGIIGGGDDLHVTSDDGAIGTSVNQSPPQTMHFADVCTHFIANLVASSSGR